MNKDTQEKIQKLQILEQNIQNLSIQKQNFQQKLMEINSASSEVEHSEKAFKIIGNIMVSIDNKKLSKDLIQEKEKIDLRIKTVEKQEKSLREKMKNIQEDVMKEIENDRPK